MCFTKFSFFHFSVGIDNCIKDGYTNFADCKSRYRFFFHDVPICDRIWWEIRNKCYMRVPSCFVCMKVSTLKFPYCMYLFPHAFAKRRDFKTQLSAPSSISLSVRLSVTKNLNLAHKALFYAPGSNDRRHIVFILSVCLFVCLSVVNFNLWTITFEL